MVTRQAAGLDVGMVATCSLAYVVASLCGVAVGWVVAGVLLALVSYTTFVLIRRGESAADFGLRTDNLWQAAGPVSLGTAVAALLIIAWAVVRGVSVLHWELLFLLPLYPLWGVIQQLVFQGILHRRLLQLVGNRLICLIVTSVFFALVHIADWRVVALTFVGGLFWSWAFQRWPNIWVLGLSHGLLGALVYPLVLLENPLGRVF